MPTITVTVPTGKANNFMHRAKVRAGLGGLLLWARCTSIGEIRRGRTTAGYFGRQAALRRSAAILDNRHGPRHSLTLARIGHVDAVVDPDAKLFGNRTSVCCYVVAIV